MTERTPDWDARTPWEHEYHKLKPYHGYRRWSNWTDQERDVYARAKCIYVGLVKDHGNLSSQARRHAIKMADFERGEKPMPQAWFDQHHSPGNEPSLIQTLIRYSRETQHGAAHVKRWKRALTALGHDTGEPALTGVEAQICYLRFSKARWRPVLEAMGQPAPAEPAPEPTTQDWSHLPEWTRQQASDYFRDIYGFTQFSGAYLDGRRWIFKHGIRNATRGYREYVVCDDGLMRPVGKPLAREA